MGYIMAFGIIFGLIVVAISVTKYFEIDLVSWFVEDEIS